MKDEAELRAQTIRENLSEEQLRDQNEKLRAAIKKLKQDFDLEVAMWEQKLNEAENRTAIIPELEQKAADVEMLLEIIEQRDKQIQDMEGEVEEAREAIEMIESLTEDNVKKDAELEEMHSRMQELIDEAALNEEIS